MPANTSRLQLPYPVGGDTVDVPRDINALATKLDPLVATEAEITTINSTLATKANFSQGAAASRPAAGTAGRFYYASDSGALTYDNGTAWVTEFDPTAANFGQGTAASRPAAGTAGRFYYATDTNVLSYDNGTAWISVPQVAQGTAANRPAAGRSGRLYYATDTGDFSYDTGSAWVLINPTALSYSVGPVTGSGVAVGGTAGAWVALPGLTLSFTSPGYVTRCLVQYQVSMGSGSGAWNYVGAGLNVAPAPTARVKGNAVSGAAGVNTSQVGGFMYLMNTAQIAGQLVGWDAMTLAANTAYTISGLALAGGASTWRALPDNFISATLLPA